MSAPRLSTAGIQWITSLDHRPIGDGERGPISSKLGELYDSAVRGALPRYRRWLP